MVISLLSMKRLAILVLPCAADYGYLLAINETAHHFSSPLCSGLRLSRHQRSCSPLKKRPFLGSPQQMQMQDLKQKLCNRHRQHILGKT